MELGEVQNIPFLLAAVLPLLHSLHDSTIGTRWLPIHDPPLPRGTSPPTGQTVSFVSMLTHAMEPGHPLPNMLVWSAVLSDQSPPSRWLKEVAP